MPTLSSSVVPPPKSWDEFEDIALAASKLRWGNSDFERNGRSGQKQDGVDVFGYDDDRFVGIQCKNTIAGVSLSVIKTEIANAESFSPSLDRLYIATTAPRDANIQKEVRLLSDARKFEGKFRVFILFWDDLCQELAKSDEVFFSHFPQFRSRTSEAIDHDRKLFDELIVLLKSKGVIGFLDKSNMAGFSFSLSDLDPLREFAYNWGDPEKEFLSSDLELLRSQLFELSNSYLDIISVNTWTIKPHHERSSVPPEWEIEQPERFSRVVEELHSLAGKIVETHGNLVRVGKHQLIGAIQ